MAALRTIAAPALPFGTAEYDRRYQDQLNTIQRLYYNQLDTAINATIGRTQGGKYLFFPYAAVQRTTDKTFTANTATQVTFDTTDFSAAITNDTTDGLHVDNDGIYNYQFSVQFANTDSQIHTAWIWLRVNGVDVDGTASRFDVISSHGGTDGYIIAAANFYVQLTANDHVEMWAAVSNTAVFMEAYPVQTSPFPMPSIPSVVATLTFVSNLP